MALWGTIVNVLLILIGGGIGLLLKKGVPDRIERLIMDGIALTTLVMGLDYTLQTGNYLWIIISLVIGALIGEWLDIDKRIEGFGHQMKKYMKAEDNRFVDGMMTATLLFCVGAMAIMGALDSGLRGDHTVLITKGIMDGISALLFAGSLGIGVLFSVIPLFIYQGAITLLSGVVAPFLTDAVILEVSAVGGVLLMGLGLSILGIKKIKVANMLPAMLIMGLIAWFL